MRRTICVTAMLLLAGSAFAQSAKEVAVFTKNKIDPAFEEARVGAEKRAAELGLTVIQYAPTKPNNFQEQIAEVEDAIVRKPLGMLFVPVDTQGLRPSVDKVRESKIPIVNFIDDNEGTFDGKVIINNTTLATELTNVLAEKMGKKGKLVLIEGIKGNPTNDARTEGVLNAVKAFPDIEVLAVQPANFQSGQAMQVMENLLQQFPQIDAVVANSDNMALAILEAFAAAGRPQPYVVGMDGTVDGVASVKAGGLLAVTDFSLFQMGCLGIEMVDKLAKGESVPARIELAAPVVTAENAGDYGLPLDQKKCLTLADIGK